MSTGTRDLTPRVEHCLRTKPRTRDDDFALYYSVVSDIVSPSIISTISFRDIMLNAHQYGIPPFGSVTRVRRQLQSQNEEYRGRLYKARIKRELDFREEFGNSGGK